jgi:K+-transporting ATPase ATPase C chain
MASLRRDLATATIAIVFLTLLLGVAYPLATTGIAQLAFPGPANGSRVEAGGRIVGSRLIGQDFRGLPRYFQSRPSASGFSADVTRFANLGPNSRELSVLMADRLRAYLRRERPHDPGLTAAAVPVDAIASSASGVDPQISVANARIQAHRVADARGLALRDVLDLVGEPGVNVLELNLALDREDAG